MEKKVEMFFNYIVVLVMFSLLGFSIIFNLRKNESAMLYDTAIQNRYFVCFMLIVCVVSYFVYRLEVAMPAYTVFLGVFMIVSEFILVFTLSSEIGWDCGMVLNAAQEKNLEICNEYLSIYPNNLLLVLIFRVWNDLLNSGNDMYILNTNLLNIIAMGVSYVLIYLISSFYFENKVTKLTLLYFVCIIGISPWIIIPYSDIQMMPWGLLLVYCFMIWEMSSSRRKIVLMSMKIGALCFVGLHIKPTFIVVYVALFGMNFLRKKKDVVCVCVGSLLIIFLLNMCWNSAIYKLDTYDLDSDMSFPMTHYIMLGLNNNKGIYTEEDYQITCQGRNKKEKVEANIEQISLRMKSRNFGEHMKCLGEKVKLLYAEGNFYWGGEGGPLSFLNFDLGKYSFIRKIFYVNGENYDIYKYSVQGLWFTLLIFVMCNIFHIHKKNIGIFFLVIFGITLFNLLFEMRSRYLISFLPFYCILSATGIENVIVKIEEMIKKLKCLHSEKGKINDNT